MASRTLAFYATREDLVRVMRRLELQRLVKYARHGYFDTPEAEVYFRSVDLPPLGQWDAAHNIYLVSDFAAEIQYRTVGEKPGPVEYVSDPMKNHEAVNLSTGGCWRPRVLAGGSLYLLSNHASATEIFELAASLIRAEFVEIRGVHLGPDALGLARQGWRLTPFTSHVETNDFLL